MGSSLTAEFEKIAKQNAKNKERIKISVETVNSNDEGNAGNGDDDGGGDGGGGTDGGNDGVEDSDGQNDNSQVNDETK